MVRHLRREGVRIGRRLRPAGLWACWVFRRSTGRLRTGDPHARAPCLALPAQGACASTGRTMSGAPTSPTWPGAPRLPLLEARPGHGLGEPSHVLAWRLSNTLDAGFCVEALEEALERYSTLRDLQYRSRQPVHRFALHTGRWLQAAGIRISMDARRGRCMDNIFIERLWRSLKYEARLEICTRSPTASRARRRVCSGTGSASTRTSRGLTRRWVGGRRPRPDPGRNACGYRWTSRRRAFGPHRTGEPCSKINRQTRPRKGILPAA